MDFMIAAAVAALLNIGLLGGIMFTYLQNIRLVKSYFTYGLVIVAALFIIQNIVIVVFWSQLYLAGPEIKNIVDAAAPYLFAINSAQSVGLAVLLWITRKWLVRVKSIEQHRDEDGRNGRDGWNITYGIQGGKEPKDIADLGLIEIEGGDREGK